MLHVYGDLESGNCYKVKLLLEFLRIEHQWTYIEVLRDENKTPEFLRINPNGKIPVLEIEPGMNLPESGAILNYLAEGTPFLPADRWLRAQILQWMFFEQYEVEPNIAVARYWLYYLKDPASHADRLPEKQAAGNAALQIMEQHLQERRYFVDERLTIADIALYGYTHVAEEGGFTLAPFPAIRHWLKRIEAEKHYFPMRVATK